MRTRLSLVLPLLFIAVASGSSCRQTRPGDSGGAATSDDIRSGAVGAAPSNDSFERRRPRDTTLPNRTHDARGGDTTAH
jgi:hypothetical protein